MTCASRCPTPPASSRATTCASAARASARSPEITPVAQHDGTITGVLDLKLEKLVEPLPTDSTVIVRPRSARRPQVRAADARAPASTELPNGGSLPLSQAKPIPVELDEFFDMFDEETRRGAQGSLQAFGDAFAGRGDRHQLRDPGPRPVPRQAGAGASATWRATQTDLRGFFDGPRAERRRRRAASPRRRPSCSATSTSPSAPSPRVARPVHPGVDLRGPGDARRRDRVAAEAADVPRQLERDALHRASSRASTRSPNAAPDLAEPDRAGHADARRARPRSTQRIASHEQEPREVLDRPARPSSASRT